MNDLGALLVSAREGRGLTLEDAERDTRISRRYLRALETGQFEVIPAPVYARGFLRSYSQYLGLNPQEMLSLFPREADYPETRDNQKPSRENPIPAQSASRPTWRRPDPEPMPRRPDGRPPQRDERRQGVPAQRPPQQRAAPFEEPPPQPRRAREAAYDDDDGRYEPMIGVDIGVPAPARRIQTDPAAQTRTLVVAVVAIAAILGIVLLAYMISNAGGDDGTDTPPGTGAGGDAADETATRETTATGGSTTTSGIAVTPGVVPAVEGYDIVIARDAIERAGLTVNEIHDKNAAPAGEVVSVAPPAGTPMESGKSVTVVVSDGP